MGHLCVSPSTILAHSNQYLPSQSLGTDEGRPRTQEGMCHSLPWLCSSSPSCQLDSSLSSTEFPGLHFQLSLLFIGASEYFNPWGGGTGEQHPPPALPATFPGLSAETRAKLSPASVGETNRGRSLKQDQHLPPCAWRGLGKERREGAREAACNYRVRGSDKMIMEEF